MNIDKDYILNFIKYDIKNDLRITRYKLVVTDFLPPDLENHVLYRLREVENNIDVIMEYISKGV